MSQDTVNTKCPICKKTDTVKVQMYENEDKCNYCDIIIKYKKLLKIIPE